MFNVPKTITNVILIVFIFAFGMIPRELALRLSLLSSLSWAAARSTSAIFPNGYYFQPNMFAPAIPPYSTHYSYDFCITGGWNVFSILNKILE